MLSVSRYNAAAVENHRYIYKKDFNVTNACKELGIKSKQTFYNAIDRLQLAGLIDIATNVYYLYAINWIEINVGILSGLVSYAKTRDQDIDLLRVYLILKKMNKIAEKKTDKDFTLRQLCILLGHSDKTNVYYENIRTYLALLSFWGLIELKQHKEFNQSLGVAYTIYHLQSISEVNVNPSFEMDIEQEKNAALPSEELMEKLRFCFPEIMKDGN